MGRLIIAITLLSGTIVVLADDYKINFGVEDRLRYEAKEDFSPVHNDKMSDLVNRLIIDGELSFRNNGYRLRGFIKQVTCTYTV